MTCGHSDSSEKPSAGAGRKNSEYYWYNEVVPTFLKVSFFFLIAACILFEVKVKLATLVEVDQKAPFSIATTPSCREGHYSFPCIAPLYP